MPNRPGRMQSTTAEPPGEFRFEFWVLRFELAQRHDQITNCLSVSRKTQNPKLNFPPDADNKECRNQPFRESSG